MSCKYCAPPKGIHKTCDWHLLEVQQSLENDAIAYLVPENKNNRCELVLNTGELYGIILNYCPICGRKLAE